MRSVARIVMRADEVMGAGRHLWSMHRVPGAQSTFVRSLDDLTKATVANARPGQPIGVFRRAGGLQLSLLDSRFKGAATMSPHNYPSLGGLTLRVESVQALDDTLLGVTHMTSQGRMGRFYEQGVIPNSAVFG